MTTPADIIDEAEAMLENEEYDELRARLVPLMERYHHASVREACETVESLGSAPTIDEVAKSAGRDPEEIERILDETVFADEGDSE